MQKVIFLGLDNAGKTSILIALNKKFNFDEELKNLKPTVKIERSTFTFMNTEFTQQDFGGQEKYRVEYLKHKDRFLSNTDLLFYVVDVQDPDRFEISLEYFSQVAEYFKQDGIKLPIIILLHKLDPELKKQKAILKNVMELKKTFNEWLPYHNIYFFETSVFDVLTVLDAFSFGMAQIFEKREILDNFLKEVGEKFSTISLMLLDENGVIMGEYYKEHLKQNEREKIRSLFVSTQKRIKDESNNVFEFSDWISYKTRISGVILSFKVGYLKFFVLFVIEEKEEAEALELLDEFEAVKENLSQILESIISNNSVTI